MQIIWSPLVIERVTEIARYIALDKPSVDGFFMVSLMVENGADIRYIQIYTRVSISKLTRPHSSGQE